MLKIFAAIFFEFICRCTDESDKPTFIMSRLYDTVEPAVIDDEMLRRAVEEQGPKEEAGRIAKQEGIAYSDVIALRLDFRSKF